MSTKATLRSNRHPEGATDVMSLVSIIGLVLLYGLVISLYTMMIRFTTFHASSEDAVKQATTDLAAKLSSIYVEDAVFGRVGIADVAPTDARPSRITSLNRLYATNRLDTLIAKSLALPGLWDSTDDDLRRLNSIQQRLQTLLIKQVDSNVNPNGDDSSLNWYARTYKKLSSTFGGDEVLQDLHIRLGTLSPSQVTSGIPGIATAADQNILKAGQYRANVPISSGSEENLYFYQLAPQPHLCDANQFIDSPAGVIPSVVLVEASFKSSQRVQKIDIVKTRVACGIAGGLQHDTSPSALMVSFPHGMPPSITCLRDLFSLQEHSGQWQQALGGGVPGPGHLVRPADYAQFEMPAGKAVQLSFYHWLRSLGSEVQMSQVVELLDMPWQNIASEQAIERDRLELPDPSSIDIGSANSAITKDTGARAFALLYKSAPGGAGQIALRNAFEAGVLRAGMPHSAIPLRIDKTGNCNVSGNFGFDTVLVSEFLSAVYDTNIAAVESQAIARSIIQRLDAATQQIRANMNMTTEEFNSVKARLEMERASERHPLPELLQRRIGALEKSRVELDATLAAQDLKVKQYGQVVERAKTVISNAEQAAMATFDLSSHIDRYMRNGLTRGAGQPASFVLSDERVFTPLRKAISEEQIYRPDQFQLEEKRSWVSKNFTFVDRLSQPPVSMSSGNQPPASASPRFTILDSRLLTGKGSRILVLPTSPFADSGVTSGQLAFYSQDCVRSGAKPQVGWSVLIRDLMATSARGWTTLASKESKWFSSDEMQSSAAPGLAIEVQVRSPMALFENIPAGKSVLDPSTGERVFQVPPTPAAML